MGLKRSYFGPDKQGSKEQQQHCEYWQRRQLWPEQWHYFLREEILVCPHFPNDAAAAAPYSIFLLHWTSSARARPTSFQCSSLLLLLLANIIETTSLNLPSLARSFVCSSVFRSPSVRPSELRTNETISSLFRAMNVAHLTCTKRVVGQPEKREGKQKAVEVFGRCRHCCRSWHCYFWKYQQQPRQQLEGMAGRSLRGLSRSKIAALFGCSLCFIHVEHLEVRTRKTKSGLPDGRKTVLAAAAALLSPNRNEKREAKHVSMQREMTTIYLVLWQSLESSSNLSRRQQREQVVQLQESMPSHHRPPTNGRTSTFFRRDVVRKSADGD